MKSLPALYSLPVRIAASSPANACIRMVASWLTDRLALIYVDYLTRNRSALTLVLKRNQECLLDKKQLRHKNTIYM